MILYHSQVKILGSSFLRKEQKCKKTTRRLFKVPGLWVQGEGLVEPVRADDLDLFLRASWEAAGTVVTLCLLFLASPGTFPVAADSWHFSLSYD